MTATLPPVALLHGWGGSPEITFAGWREALGASGRTIIAPNLPGHGGPRPIDAAAYADLAIDLAACLPPGTIDVVGYSLGGKLALAIAARDRSRFRRIVIGGVGDNLFAPEPAAEALAGALVDGIRSDTPPQIAALVRYASGGGNDPQALAAVLRRAPNPVLTAEDLSTLTDVMLVNGDGDRIAKPDARLRAALPSATCLSLAGIDHLSLPADPTFCAAAVAFLGGG